MIHAQIVLVTSPGGARGDFVAGWLGTLPNFIDNYWSIDPLSGKSRGLMDGAKSLDQGASFNDMLSGQHIIPTPNVDLYWAGSCHGFKLKDLVPDIKSMPIKILPISTKGVDKNLIYWEFITKTYSNSKKTFGMHSNQQSHSIDHLIKKSPITDQHRASELQQLINGPAQSLLVENYIPNELLGNLVNYKDLFRAGGSYLLCEVLGINSATKENHKFWDLMLPAADAPVSFVAWGQEFSMRR